MNKNGCIKRHGRFAAACMAVMLALTPAASAVPFMGTEVMAATTTAKPSESRITSLTQSVENGVNTVSLSWNKAENTTNYRIYYKEAGGSWELMKTVGSAKTSAVVSSSTAHPINNGVTYYFTVRTYNKNSGKYGLWDKTGTKVCFSVAAPGRSDITSAVPSVKSGVNSISLSWTAAENVTHYKVYYKEVGGSWKRIKTLVSSKTSGTFSSTSAHTFTSGTAYLFTVRSYNSETGKYGAWDKTGTKVTFPKETVNDVVKVTSVSITGVGNTIAGAHGLKEDEGILKLGAEIKPSNATDKTVRWTSSNPGVATVSSDGTVKMLKGGETTIRVQANGGDVSAIYKLDVVDEEKMALEIFELTNKERTKAGKAPLKNSMYLHEYAMTRAKEISIKFEHDRLDGSPSGYTENIISAFASSKNASAVIARWMNSPGHKTAILANNDITIGVGVYIEDGTMYCVQEFCDMDMTQTFTVILDCNGGTGPSSITVYQKQEIYQEDLPTPERPGYTFKGWALYGRAIFKTAVINRDNMTLTAMWEEI